ncbi:hypothetical protein CGMCC3_g17792 [Colletotrichum fructicola]|nr:uncharacterized protein CGMCC3_g17792 [Colletotrichum fructicola]KAE9566030.1 hypothetical protein CGMCC3_g17792 [Colletotrichum fructicola]
MLLCEAVASLAIAPTHDSRLCPLESEETNLTATVATVATENGFRFSMFQETFRQRYQSRGPAIPGCKIQKQQRPLFCGLYWVVHMANEKGFILINSLVFVRTDILTSWRLAQASCLIQHSSIFPHGPACSWRLHLPNPLLDHHVP